MVGIKGAFCVGNSTNVSIHNQVRSITFMNVGSVISILAFIRTFAKVQTHINLGGNAETLCSGEIPLTPIRSIQFKLCVIRKQALPNQTRLAVIHQD
jgi:hypothetical protein